MKQILKQWVPSIAIALIVSFGLRTYVAEAMSVPTDSMVPTIKVHDRLFVQKLTNMTLFKHGDIVVFYPPVRREENTRYVKRLIGLPGDIIEIKDGSLYRNHEKISEPYINNKMNYTFGPVTVPDDNYFFLGDNRNRSFDSHLWETPFVEKDKIVGKVMFGVPTHVFFK